MTNEAMAAWNRYFITALRDLKNPQLKNLQEDIKSNILKKLNKVKLIATKEQLQEIMALFTRSEKGIRDMKYYDYDFTNADFTGLKIKYDVYYEEYRTSLKVTRNGRNCFITTANIISYKM